MSDPVAQFDSLLANSKFLFIVYFRGHWCPFCISYLKSLHGIEAEIKSESGTPIIVTSEPQEHLAATRAATGYEGLVIVDPENKLVAELKSRGLLDVAISRRTGYEHGMAQPAVLVIEKSGEVLEKWAIVPGIMNMNGAKDRPSVDQIWENVKAKSAGNEPLYKKYSILGAMGLLKSKLYG